MTQQLSLELRHLRKEFGAFTALRDINLGIRQGEFVCFLGPSGCGKTTLLRIIAGLEVQSAGEVWQAGPGGALRGRQARDVAARLPHLAARLLLQPRDDAQQGGLAAARGPEEADELALADAQVDAVQRGEATELFADLAQIQEKLVRHFAQRFSVLEL